MQPWLRRKPQQTPASKNARPGSDEESHASKDYGPGGSLVNERTLLEARQCLESLKLASVKDMTKTAEVQYHLVRSDQYFREQRTVDAISHVQTASVWL